MTATRKLAPALIDGDGQRFERRFFIDDKVHRVDAAELRFVQTAKSAGYITGKIPYDSWSLPIDFFLERIRPGAFVDSLKANPDVFGLWQHDPEKVLARTTAGTLIIRDTPTALEFSMSIAATTIGVDAYTLIKRGDVTGVSFGFYVVTDKWYEQDGIDRRDLIAIRCSEISIVGEPAYPEAQCEAAPRPTENTEADRDFLIATRRRVLDMQHERQALADIRRDVRLDRLAEAEAEKSAKENWEWLRRELADRRRERRLQPLLAAEHRAMMREYFREKRLKELEHEEWARVCYQNASPR